MNLSLVRILAALTNTKIKNISEKKKVSARLVRRNFELVSRIRRWFLSLHVFRRRAVYARRCSSRRTLSLTSTWTWFSLLPSSFPIPITRFMHSYTSTHLRTKLAHRSRAKYTSLRRRLNTPATIWVRTIFLDITLPIHKVHYLRRLCILSSVAAPPRDIFFCEKRRTFPYWLFVSAFANSTNFTSVM